MDHVIIQVYLLFAILHLLDLTEFNCTQTNAAKADKRDERAARQTFTWKV